MSEKAGGRTKSEIKRNKNGKKLFKKKKAFTEEAMQINQTMSPD